MSWLKVSIMFYLPCLWWWSKLTSLFWDGLKPLTTIPSHIYIYYRRKFRSQTSNNMDRWKKQRWEESEGRREEETRSEKIKSEKKEDAGARKGRKVAKHCVVPMFWGSGGSKSRLPKAAGAEPSGQMRDEKLHAVVARSTFRSQHVQSTSCSEHFWKLRCRKSARWCGAKHMSKSSQNHKTHHTRSTFGSWDVEKVYAVVVRSTFPSQNVTNTTCSDHFWTVSCGLRTGFCTLSKVRKM